MALVRAAWVRRRLRRLTRPEFAAFVAALWEARGAEATVGDGDRVVEITRHGHAESLRVVTGRRLPVEGDETVRAVCARPASELRASEPSVSIVDADDLHAMLLYAVPRDDAAAICRRFLDGSLHQADPEPYAAGQPWLPESSGTVAVALLGVLLVVASVFGGPMLGEGVLESSFGAPPSAGSETGADTVSTTTPTPTEEAVPAQSGRLPPGLESDGSIDENRLADAHATTLTGQSYRLTLTYREFLDGQPTAYRREVVYVASPTEYRTTLEGAGDLRAADMVISNVEAYSDGETRYEHRRTDEAVDHRTARTERVRPPRNGEGRYADRVEQYLQWYLSVSTSSIVDVDTRDGTQYVWVTLGEDPYPGVENSAGSALIDENGIVHEVTRRYDVPRRAGLSAEVTIRYTDIGRTTVEPPAWYAGETNETPSTGDETLTATPTNATPPPAATSTPMATPTAAPTRR